MNSGVAILLIDPLKSALDRALEATTCEKKDEWLQEAMKLARGLLEMACAADAASAGR